jgi:hypothetical protein
MKFMISFTHVTGDWADRVPRWAELSDEEKQGVAGHLKDAMDALETEQGTKMVFFDAPENARTVRIHKDGSLDVEENALLRGNESVGGYFIIEVDSMDEALDWAKRTRWLVGANEVREIKEMQF